jgi:feruloyl esterase
VTWQATHLLITLTKKIVEVYYNRPAKSAYLFGCSTGGRQAYHIAQKFPHDFDGILVSCPSITQSHLFASLGHPHIVIHNDLKDVGFTPEQLEVVSQKAIAIADTAITGQHDGYVTIWQDNAYDPSQDPSIISINDGGNCTQPWALTKAQCHAINKIWYGPTLDGSIPDPATDNGANPERPSHQLWWGKLRGTRIEFANVKRDIVGNILALSYKDPSLAPPSWNHRAG